MKPIIVIGLLLALSGCASLRPYNPPTCPPLVTYSPEQMKQASQELRALPKESVLGTMIVDYGKHRAACRVQ